MDISAKEFHATPSVGASPKSYSVWKGNHFGISQNTFAELGLPANAVSQQWTSELSLYLATAIRFFHTAPITLHVSPLDKTHKLLWRHLQCRSESFPKPKKHDLQGTAERLAVIPATRERPKGSLKPVDVCEGAEREGTQGISPPRAAGLLGCKLATTTPREQEAD